jgi:hypothetical protein
MYTRGTNVCLHHGADSAVLSGQKRINAVLVEKAHKQGTRGLNQGQIYISSSKLTCHRICQKSRRSAGYHLSQSIAEREREHPKIFHDEQFEEF